MVTLIILDGFGLDKHKFGNAIAAAGTPHLDKLKKEYPYTTLNASGEHVGLPKGQMGNSEVGHLTIGSGRVVLQDLEKINHDIKNKVFHTNPQLLKAISHAKENNSSLHILGLLSDGGVHSHINHLFAIIDTAKEQGLTKLYIHAITDGRDTPINSGIKYIEKLQEKLAGTPYKIASIAGRVYTMDREKRYERLQKAYNMMIFGENSCEKDAISIINDNYKQGIYDEFILPTLLDKDGTIKDNDSVIFFNFRADRAIEITNALTNPDFKAFEVKKFTNLLFSPMKMYSEAFARLNIIYPEEKIHDSLAAIISQHGLKQYHIAETTKYAHVTFYFNGGIEEQNKGEERKLIESIDTQDFSYYPKMRAEEITMETLDAIASNKYDFILVNYSNPDMIGHTGNFEATKQAISCVEKNAYALALATLMTGGDCIITADHGNAENMIDKNGNKITSHTSNPVPLYFVSDKNKKVKLKKNMSIANIAPTVLKLLNINIPSSMEKPLF
ncbi:MAG: 2,3-bisphosphoglycerate-independent phosphoglycerate mutase [Clostridia bacterium]|nr:2,3-bisphosphoglycerate-independent phosphoglycerate mutase [Clostridia bacterium]